MLKIANFVRRFWILFLIAGLYFLFAVLNLLPTGLNIFRKQQLIIDDTPVIVKEIKELGDLTTSEFYGEVYADINEVYDDVLEKLKDSITLNPGTYYLQYSGLKDYMIKADNFRLKEIEYKSEKERYENAVTEHLKKLEAFRDDEKKLNDEMAGLSDDKKEKKQLKNRLDDLRQKLEEEKTLFLDAQKRYTEFESSYNIQKEDFWQSKKSRNLVYIGRGWVKAGIDLKNLSEDDIIIDDGDSTTIQILISDPEVLDADINPWFIYTDEKKVKGFEVFIAKTGSILTDKNFTDFEVTQLKIKCKEKLKIDALNKGLMKSAKTSAVQTLENFFHLIGFQKVEVHFKSNTIVETAAK